MNGSSRSASAAARGRRSQFSTFRFRVLRQPVQSGLRHTVAGRLASRPVSPQLAIPSNDERIPVLRVCRYRSSAQRDSTEEAPCDHQSRDDHLDAARQHVRVGDFKGDPHALVAKYFDALLYYANWGTRRLILRVPTARLDAKVVRQYCPILRSRSRRNSSVATATIVDGHFVIDLWSEDESGDDWSDSDPGSLSALVPIRNELIAGDYRALYLAWRLRVQAGEINPNAPAPPRIGGSKRTTGSQRALAEFLRIDSE